jgi:hypothetical protein
LIEPSVMTIVLVIVIEPVMVNHVGDRDRAGDDDQAADQATAAVARMACQTPGRLTHARWRPFGYLKRPPHKSQQRASYDDIANVRLLHRHKVCLNLGTCSPSRPRALF